MPLLNATQINQVKAAVALVTDQFFTGEVAYQRRGMSFDLYQEDRTSQAVTTWNFNALVTPVATERTEAERETHGAREMNEVILTVNMKDLEAIGGIVNTSTWEINMDATKDYFTLNGSTHLYRVLRITKHGPLEKRDVLVKIYGRIEEKKAAAAAN